MIKAWFEIALWKRIMVAMILGVLVGGLWGLLTGQFEAPPVTGQVEPEDIGWWRNPGSIGWLGDLFIRLIRMIVVPLVFVTVIAGVVSMGDPSKLGSLGVKTLVLYMATTLVAITIGLTFAVLAQPGEGVEFVNAPRSDLQEPVPLVERLMSIVPSNPIAALAEGNILAVIFCALLIGVALLAIGDKGKTMADFMDAASEVVLRITHWIMEIAPFGVFALIVKEVGTNGFGPLRSAAALAATVFAACAVHLIIMHGAVIMRFMLNLSPVNFFRSVRDAMLVAFSTSSSAATLPVSISVAEENLGVKPVVASTVLPIGATINMDGTALYVGIVSVFAAQAFGLSLGLADYLLMAGITTLVSIGTAAVPSASLFLMAAVMEAIGLSAAQIAVTVGFIFIIDRPLDMLRTVVNVTGDLSVSTAVANWENEFDREVFEQPVKY